MTSEAKGKKIRARYGLTRLPDGDVGHLLVSSLNGLTNNATRSIRSRQLIRRCIRRLLPPTRGPFR